MVLKTYEETILSNLIDELETISDEKHSLLIGNMEENYYVGNGEFEKVKGILCLNLNNSEKYRFVGDTDKGRVIDDFDVWDSEAKVEFFEEFEKGLLEFVDEIFERAKEDFKDKMLVMTKNFKK